MKEQLSALIDNEISIDDNPHLLTALKGSDEYLECWKMYHLIGDSMRGDSDGATDLTQRIMAQIDHEPTILAPRPSILKKLRSEFAIPVFATAAAVGFVGLMVWQSGDHPSATSIAPVAQIQVAPDALQNYMLAHHEYAPSNGVQSSEDLKLANFSEARN